MINKSGILKIVPLLLIVLMVSVFVAADKAYSYPNAPQLDYPWTGMNVGGETIPFRWYEVYGAGDYYLQIATDSGFTDIVYGSWMWGSILGIDLCCFSDVGEWYYWRVTAYDGEVGPASSTWFFINGPSAPPAIPTLSSPANGANASGTTITFQWNQAARATNYHLQVARDAGFTNFIFDDWVGNSIGVNLLDLPDNGETYYWRVASWNTLGTSSFSSPRSLVNGPSALPSVPTLSSPANGANPSSAVQNLIIN